MALSCTLAACASNQVVGAASQIEVTDLQQLPDNSEAAFHKIGPQEFLEVKVLGSELLSGKFLTDAAGRIDYPLIGQLDLNGLSPGQGAELIAQRLRGRYVLDPNVTVIPEELDAITFSVGGQVKKPGDFPFNQGLTLLRALNIAGGQDDYAKLDEVLVFREVEGQNYIGVYDVGAIQKGNYPDPKIYPNDIVMVGDSSSKRRVEALLDLLPSALSALILIERVGSQP